MTPMLELIKLDKWFGGLQVTNNLSLCVGHQEIVSVIGPNGAGKSTLLNLITGIYRPDHGAIIFQGQSLLGKAPHTITRLGIARTFQTLRVFLNLSVIDNVMRQPIVTPSKVSCQRSCGRVAGVPRKPPSMPKRRKS